ncbi:NADH-ubiquinone oxidoreductase B8 subunit [Operophtera brumata]|uniref:NADH dehydrogenase [ubiquinone] 1 alpha subcomplex subunit 2 n=1 Tax=Operophtera brumata TaxID=104452 RepID=A0A0L7K267_OPEBR|nr:NADH-ubiquinone oxidoreductase B8 subunit [Operophtera brumata]
MALRLGGALKELRIHLCQTSKQSEGVREFIKNNYVNIKKENPSFPILIRECSGVMPCVWARYGMSLDLPRLIISNSTYIFIMVTV